jgi:signal peptidase I
MTVVRLGQQQSKRSSSLFLRRVTPGMIVLILLAIAALRLWVVETAIVEGRSMEGTLLPGDRVLVLKLLHPTRFDVVLMNDPDGRGVSIKRIIGIPGDVVSIIPRVFETSRGQLPYGSQVYLNGRPYEEPYAAALVPTSMRPIEMPADTYFVLGDNRDLSIDSRRYGPVSADSIRGVAVAVVFPFARIALIEPGSQNAALATAQTSS